MTELRYLAIKDESGKWQIYGAYTLEGIETVIGEAIEKYGQENVTLAISPKEIDALNRGHMIGQLKGVGQKFTTGLGGIVEGYEKYADQTRNARSRPLMKPSAKPTMEPPMPRQTRGMMPPPSDYAKMKPHEQPTQRQFTKYGRPIRPLRTPKLPIFRPPTMRWYTSRPRRRR